MLRQIMNEHLLIQSYTIFVATKENLAVRSEVEIGMVLSHSMEIPNWAWCSMMHISSYEWGGGLRYRKMNTRGITLMEAVMT